MDDPYVSLTKTYSEAVDPLSLAHSHSRAIAHRLSREDYPGRLIECRRQPNAPRDLIIAEVDVELGQRELVNDIRTTERIAIAVCWDDSIPSVFPLRPDFPVVPHLNLAVVGDPKSLCLYDQYWDDIAPGWTPLGFLERIRWWLAQTAYGELHGDHQPLEPLLGSSGFRLIVPPGIADAAARNRVQFTGEVVRVEGTDDDTLFLFPTSQPDSQRPPNAKQTGFVVSIVLGNPQAHGRIAGAPRTLRDLIEFCDASGVDLNGALRQRIRDAVAAEPALLARKLLLVLVIPVRRREDGPVEEHQTFAFLIDKTLGDVGVDLDSVQLVDVKGDGTRRYGAVLATTAQAKRGESTDVGILEVYEGFSRKMAERASAAVERPLAKIVLVGAGALGSEICILLARRGFGQWTIIDNDVLLPHNMARHALPSWMIGENKAVALSGYVRHLLNDGTFASPISANILHPSHSREAIAEAAQQADIILDASASVAVSRTLSLDAGSKARRVAVFLNPSGTAAVLLAEDAARITPLDVLEQYYLRAVSNSEALESHLHAASEGFRYSASCRHPSAQIPGSNVSALASVAAPQIERLAETPQAIASVWQLSSLTGSISRLLVPLAGHAKAKLADWEIVLLDSAREEMARLRETRLPNETDGVLIGSVDRVRKRLYIVSALPAPPDSKERRTSFIRGVVKLRQHVERIQQRTLGQLQYIGEWHSHPKGSGLKASADDLKLYSWIAEALDGSEALPLMLIIGDAGVRVHADTDGINKLRWAAI